jgi:hypothetical protein
MSLIVKELHRRCAVYIGGMAHPTCISGCIDPWMVATDALALYTLMAAGKWPVAFMAMIHF